MDSWWYPLVPCSPHRSGVSLGVPCGTMSIPVASPWSRDANHPGSQDPHLSYLWSHAWIQVSIHQPFPSCAVPSLCTLLRSMYYDGACSYTLHLMMCTIYVLRTPIRGKTIQGSRPWRSLVSCLLVFGPLDGLDHLRTPACGPTSLDEYSSPSSTPVSSLHEYGLAIHWYQCSPNP